MGNSEDLGEVFEEGGRYRVRYVRHLAFSPEQVWNAITDPSHIADWLGDAEVELRVGGRFRITRFRDDDVSCTWTITRLVPQSLIEISGDGDVSLFELQPCAEGCTLTLTCSVNETLIGMIWGWHVFLDALRGAIVGSRIVWDEAQRARADNIKLVYCERLGISATHSAPPA